MLTQLEDRAASPDAAGAPLALPTPDADGGGDRGSTATTSAPGLDGDLDRLAPHLVRFELGTSRVVVEVAIGGRRLGLAIAVPEGEHDLVAVGRRALWEARQIVEYFAALDGAA